jgi:hypothetical protein
MPKRRKRRPAIPFDLAAATPEDFRGRKIRWTNSISGSTEEARVSPDARSTSIHNGTLTFPATACGVRSVRLSSITSVS